MTALPQPIALAEERPFSGTYTVPEAALYLRATTPPPGVPLSLWRRKREQFVAPSSRHLHAWVKRGLAAGEAPKQAARRRTVTFEDLIRLRLIAIMRSRGVPLPAILRAEEFARSVTGSPQPFITEPLWTCSTNVFISTANLLIAASQGGQLGLDFLREYMQPVNHGLDFTADGRASTWRPAEGVLVAGNIAFGAPCIEGTRIQTEIVWEMHQAGDSAPRLAALYGVSEAAIDKALAWEGTLARAT